MISSSPEVSSTAQLAQVRTETLYGVKRRMNLRLICVRFVINLVMFIDAAFIVSVCN